MNPSSDKDTGGLTNHEDGFIDCSKCQMPVHVGAVGFAKLFKRHIGSTACRENKKASGGKSAT